MNFSTKPWHVTPHINSLGEMRTVLRVSTHIFGVSQEIHRKTFIFWVNLGMWHLKSIVLEKRVPLMRDSTDIYGDSKEIDGKMFIFRVNIGMWHLKLNVTVKTSSVLRVWTDIYGVSKEIDGKTYIVQSIPRHVTPQINRLRKMSTVLRWMWPGDILWHIPPRLIDWQSIHF